MSEVVENVKSAERSGINKLTSKELDLIERVRKKYLEIGLLGCTKCMYCQSCPQSVSIPEILGIFNEYYASDKFMRDSVPKEDASRNKYWDTIPEINQANRCNSCGFCEGVCPQQLPIMKLLRNISWMMKKKKLEP